VVVDQENANRHAAVPCPLPRAVQARLSAACRIDKRANPASPCR
jgi:hypothetical protein